VEERVLQPHLLANYSSSGEAVEELASSSQPLLLLLGVEAHPSVALRMRGRP
jgi:hypothetical protein